MKHEKRKLSKMIDELIVYLFSMCATEINVNIRDCGEYYKVHMKGNYSNNQQEKIQKLVKALKCPRREEIEETYWELTGDCDVDTELTLVGVMTDKVEIDIFDNEIEITLIRYKSE